MHGEEFSHPELRDLDPDKGEELSCRHREVIAEVAFLHLRFGTVMEMPGKSGQRRVIRGIVMPMDQPPLGPMLPVKRVSASGGIYPEVDKRAVAQMKAELLG
jgi:hypothetical protein